MAKVDFDNLMQVIEVAAVFTAGTLVSTEVDLELPRGFVAKIHSILLRVDRIAEDIEGISVDKLIRYLLAIINDPDDQTQTTLGSNIVDHDLLLDLEVEVILTAGTAGDTVALIIPSDARREKSFSDNGLDTIAARNLRLNIDVEGTDLADATEAFGVVQISYTLEKVTDQDILAVLQIF